MGSRGGTPCGVWGKAPHRGTKFRRSTKQQHKSNKQTTSQRKDPEKPPTKRHGTASEAIQNKHIKIANGSAAKGLWIQSTLRRSAVMHKLTEIHTETEQIHSKIYYYDLFSVSIEITVQKTT